jgi:putative transposase
VAGQGSAGLPGGAELALRFSGVPWRDPESQASIESWFSKLKKRCIWSESSRRSATPHRDPRLQRALPPPTPLTLVYRTPREVADAWKEHDDQLTTAA